MGGHDGTSPHPVALTPNSGYISSKEQLFKDYPDHFKGIGRFPGNYKIHLKKDAKPVIHPQQNAHHNGIKAEDKA